MLPANLFVSRILDDEGITSDLNDPEARMLVEWLVEQVERIAGECDDEDNAWKRVERLCKRGRMMRRFVVLWCHRQDQGAAAQLVAAERLNWPLPSTGTADPCDVLQSIFDWHEAQAPV